jgi:tetratricopeptide (TPR) repeat protein
MGNLASTYSNLGEHQKAKELQATVLEKRKQVLGDNHPDTLLTMGNLASTYSALGEHQNAKELMATVLEKRKQVLGDNHPDTLLTMGNLASTYSALGEHQNAKELQATVLEKRKQVLGDNHPDTLLTMGNLASTYSGLGEHQKAKELMVTVLEKQNPFPLSIHSPLLPVSPSPPPLQPSHASSSLPPLRKLGRGLKKPTVSVAAKPAPAGETKATRKHALQDNTRPHWR